MAQAAIQVQGLGKQYRLGERAPYKSVRESLMNSFAKLFRNGQSQIADKDSASGTFWALKDLNFDIYEGDTVGVIGRNGAGKSTLLKILSRVTTPTEGCAEVRGRVGSLLEVGTGFHPELTGRENVFLNGAILGMGQRDISRKFEQIVEFAEVDRFLDTPVKYYSSGMYTRLAFSVAAHLEPDVLVVDEVLAVGDAEFQKKCLGRMSDVAHEGRTVLFVSHNLSQIQKLCNRAVLLNSGRVEAYGDVAPVVQQYLSGPRVDKPVVDLSGFKNTTGTGEVIVETVELLNPVAGSFSISWDTPLYLRVRLRAARDLKRISVGIGCATIESIPVFTVRSEDAEKGLFDMTQGQVREVTILIRHNLRAGLFTLVVGIASGNYVHYYNPTAAQFDVLGVGATAYLDKNPGIIHCPAEWSIS